MAGIHHHDFQAGAAMMLQVLSSPRLKTSPLCEAGLDRKTLWAVDVVNPHPFDARIHSNLMKELFKQFSFFEVESFPCIQSTRIGLDLNSERVVSELRFGIWINEENGFFHAESLSLRSAQHLCPVGVMASNDLGEASYKESMNRDDEFAPAEEPTVYTADLCAEVGHEHCEGIDRTIEGYEGEPVFCICPCQRVIEGDQN